MKKLFGLLVIALALFTLVGCTSIASADAELFENVDITVEGDDVAEVSIYGTYSRKSNAWTGQMAGTQGFELTVKNTSDSIIKILWEECSISYLDNVDTVFISGQKYTDHNNPASPTVVPKGSVVSKSVYSADQPYYVSGRYGGWSMASIPSFDNTVIICIESNGKKTYYIATINAGYIEPEPVDVQ
jgi:hypothetical protein